MIHWNNLGVTKGVTNKPTLVNLLILLYFLRCPILQIRPTPLYCFLESLRIRCSRAFLLWKNNDVLGVTWGVTIIFICFCIVSKSLTHNYCLYRANPTFI